jgi:hypothetical protein
VRRAAKRDRNERDIVEAFRAAGCSVEHLSGKGLPDLLVGITRDLMVLVEVKGKKGQLTDDQVEWHDEWRGPHPFVIRTVDEAVELIVKARLVGSASEVV